ncbi:MAG: putative membrane protein YeiB [Pseudohongiellaceae bacterium]|jgi:uncharacterized membrane protein YeiB
MHTFSKPNKRTLFVWATLLSLLMLFSQGVTLHVHSFDHNPLQNHHSIDDLNDHSHASVAHLSIDSSHEDHHDDVTSVISACPACILNQASTNVTVLAMLAMVLMLILPALCRTTFSSIHCGVKHPWRHYFFPQLRAPPLK